MSEETKKVVSLDQAETLYNDLRDRQEDIVKVSDTQPQQESNKLWIDEGEEQTYSLATTADLQELIAKLGGNFAKSYENLTLPTVAYKTFCTHDGELYLAKVVISSAEEWDASHWVKMDMATFNSAQFTEIFYQLESMSLKADKAGTVLDTTLSRGRKANTTVGEGSFAFGNNVEASNMVAHAEGLMTVASGLASHAEGVITNASGDVSHAEGNNTVASANNSHSEGAFTVASGTWSHAGGYGTTANSSYMTAIGTYNVPATLYPEWVAGTAYEVGDKVVHDGFGAECNTANSDSVWTDQHWDSIAATGEMVFVIGNGTNENNRSNAMSVDIAGNEELAGGLTLGTTLSRGRKANTTVGDASLAFGDDATASDEYAISLGYGNTASGWASYAEGDCNTASGDMSHAEGDCNTASGACAHAEGVITEATGDNAHAEGYGTVASGKNAHSEGRLTIADGACQHVSGYCNVVSGLYPDWVAGTSYSVGDRVTYNGKSYECKTANQDSSFSATKWKTVTSTGPHAVVVGNGTGESARSNAYALDWYGNGHFAGDVYVGCEADSTGGTKLAKETDVAPVIINNASGTVASFQDGAEMSVKDCVVSIEPVQDLHGQDVPYPAGGGKNKYPIAIGEDVFTDNGSATHSNNNGALVIVTNASSGSSGVYIPSTSKIYEAFNAMTTPFTVSFDIVASASGNVRFIACGEGNSISEAVGTTKVRLSRTVTDTSTKNFNIYGINNGATLTVTNLQIEAGSTATAYSPYSNICPISGWTGANVTRTGKNLFRLPNGTVSVTNGSITIANNVCTRTPTNPVQATNFLTSAALTTLGMNDEYFPGTYYFSANLKSGSIASATFVAQFVYSDGTTVTQTAGNPVTLTNKAKLNAIQFSPPLLIESTNIIVAEFQLETGSILSDFEPYSDTTYTISWQSEAGTVYGGSLDATTGALTVETACVDLRSAIPQWTKSTSYPGSYYASLTQVKNYYNLPSLKASTPFLCSHAKTVPYIVNYQSGACYCDGSVNVWIMDASSTLEEWKNYLEAQYNAGTPVQVNLTLSEPQTYQLTPIEVKTILGQNHIFADCGDISVDYCADTKTYVDASGPVTDVQINGTSILQNGIANVPVANGAGTNYGVVKISTNYGLSITPDSFSVPGALYVNKATSNDVKASTNQYKCIVPANQHESTFYGLAKSAGDTTQAESQNPFGYYTVGAKSKISQMLNGAFEIVGATPSFTALPGVRYICGECTTLTIVAPSSGCFDVKFTSGSTPTVLTVTSAKANTTIKWANGFDPTSLDADTVYEVNILDGEFGVVGSWT